MSESLPPCKCVGYASHFRHTVHNRPPSQRVERRVESEWGCLTFTEELIYFHSHTDLCWWNWHRADMQRLPVPFLTCFQQNTLFCSLLVLGHSNKMGVRKALRSDVRLLLSLMVFLLEENISPFHNLGVSQNSGFELCTPRPRCGYACVHWSWKCTVWNGNNRVCLEGGGRWSICCCKESSWAH